MRAAGADVIAITTSQSALAKKATVCLAVDHSEDSSTFLSMISRILQLLLIRCGQLNGIGRCQQACFMMDLDPQIFYGD